MKELTEELYQKTPFMYEIQGSFYAIGANVFCPITDQAEIDYLVLLSNAREKHNERQISKYTDKISRIANGYRVDAKEYLKTRDKLLQFLTELEKTEPSEIKRLQEQMALIEQQDSFLDKYT